MSHYSRTVKFINSSKFKKLKTSSPSKFVLLAIAREADKNGEKECKCSLSDDQLLQAVNFETHLYCEELTKKLLKLFGEKNPSKEMINNYLYLCIKNLNLLDGEQIIYFLEKSIIEIKSTPKRFLKEAISTIKSQFIIH